MRVWLLASAYHLALFLHHLAYALTNLIFALAPAVFLEEDGTLNKRGERLAELVTAPTRKLVLAVDRKLCESL